MAGPPAVACQPPHPTVAETSQQHQPTATLSYAAQPATVNYQQTPTQSQQPTQLALAFVPHQQQSANPFINSTNMEVVWHYWFDSCFINYTMTTGHRWILKPVSSEDAKILTNSPGVRIFKDSAKVRFLCKDCGNAWTSMKGRVVFWISLHGQAGLVQFKLYGQRCQKCNTSNYENAMWYPEEVVKVIKNVYSRVGQMFYGLPTPQHITERRVGRPRTQHNSAYCQACAEGICNERNDANKQQAAVSKLVNGVSAMSLSSSSSSSSNSTSPSTVREL
jgi:hypothetical protein